ncbi:MAG: FtsX-like permease family protein [Planctomycetota bacterium]
MLKLIANEIWFRRATAILLTLVIVLAVAILILFRTMAMAGENETRIIQRDLGLNVVILPESMTLDRYWTLGYSDKTLPQEYLGKVADQKVANRLVPMLRRPVAINGVEAMLTGIGVETFKNNKKMKAVFGREVPTGQVVLGAEVAERLNAKRDGDVTIFDQSFKVQHVLSRAGSEEDIYVYGNLDEVQQLLKLEGRIGEIQAIECHCAEDVDDPFERLKSQLTSLLPGTHVVRRESLAEGRRQQRLMAERFATWATPLLVLLCGGLVAALSALNVRERRGELGVFQALGYSRMGIATVFLGRVILLSAIGAALGALLGYLLAISIGPTIFKVSPKSIVVESNWIWGTILLTPAFAAIAALLPSVYAATLDPAESLRYE